MVNSRSFFRATAILVFLTPASTLLLKHGSSTSTTILACLGLFSLFIQGTRPLSFDEKMLFKTLLIFCGIVLLFALLGGFQEASMNKLGRYARLLLIIPTIALFLRVKRLKNGSGTAWPPAQCPPAFTPFMNPGRSAFFREPFIELMA